MPASGNGPVGFAQTTALRAVIHAAKPCRGDLRRLVPRIAEQFPGESVKLLTMTPRTILHAPGVNNSRAVIATLLVLFAAQTGQAAWLTSQQGQRVFVRGIYYSPYHPDEKAGITPKTMARDRRLITKLNANCIITAEPATSEGVAAWRRAGVYTIAQVPYQPKVMSRFANGALAEVPAYINRENRQGLYKAARDMSSALKGNEGFLAMSLGNDYHWTGFTLADNLGFSYVGFDGETLGAFQERIKDRFGTVDNLNSMTEQFVTAFGEVLPTLGLSRRPVFGEWWLFLRDTFTEYLKAGWDGARSVGSATPTTYQRPSGIRWDPASEGCSLPFTEIISGNVFHKDALDWGRFSLCIDRIISAAAGRPVLVTETGAHSLQRSPELVSRLIKQSIACTLLHPEIAGVGLFEYCDDWRRDGSPDIQNTADDAEHWGLVDGNRVQKPAYETARQMFALIERNEELFRQWQSPATILLSQQDQDWWKLRGLAGALYERVGTELYRQGVSFRLADNRALLNLDPQRHPVLILCDSFLYNEPDLSNDVLGHVVSYVESGGKLLYIASRPWQRLYGPSSPPEPLQVPADGAPAVRKYGKGQCTLIPKATFDDREIHYLITDFIADLNPHPPVKTLECPDNPEGVFWRIFEGQDGFWIFVVNATDQRIPRIDIALDERIPARQARLRESDGAGLGRRKNSLRLTGLDTYALIHLGK